MNPELHFSQLPADERAFCERLHDCFERIDRSKLNQEWRRIARELSLSYSTITAKWYRWLAAAKSGGDATGIYGLVNRAKNPGFKMERIVEVHPDTFAEFHSRCLDQGRKHTVAYRELTREYFLGQNIPGVPPGPRVSLPRGWDKKSFYAHAPTRFEIEAARRGRRAADQFRPLVFSTRKNLYAGQFITIDEMWHNFEVVIPGRKQRARLLQLSALDIFSACQFARANKPRIRREDETRANITLNDVIFLLAFIFGRHGHHPDGTTFIIEAGTSTVPEGIRDLITRLSGGKVQWHLGECRGERAFYGQFAGPNKGNFRIKAPLESLHNLGQNQEGSLVDFPGQTGANSRDSKPEDLHGRSKYSDKILKALAALPEHVQTQMRHPFPVVDAAIRAVDHVWDTINWRGALPWWKEHELEGFREAGLFTTDYHFSGGGILKGDEFLLKTPEEQVAIASAATPLCRLLAPAEVFYPAAKKFCRWRPEMLSQLLWHARYLKPLPINDNNLVEFEDEDVAPGKLRYQAMLLSPGDEIFGAVSPMMPELLFAYNSDGGFIGTLKHWNNVPKENAEAMRERVKDAMEISNLRLQPVAQAGARQTRQMAELLEHNNEILGSHADGSAEKKRAARAALMSED